MGTRTIVQQYDFTDAWQDYDSGKFVVTGDGQDSDLLGFSWNSYGKHPEDRSNNLVKELVSRTWLRRHDALRMGGFDAVEFTINLKGHHNEAGDAVADVTIRLTEDYAEVVGGIIWNNV